MDAFTLTNLLAYSGQVAVLVAAAALVPALLRVRAPGIRHAFWRAVLVTALALPFVQGSQPAPPEAHRADATRAAALPAAAATEAPLALTSDSEWSTAIWALLGAGALGRGLWLVAGLARLRRRRSSGQPAADGAFDDLQRALGTHADIRYTDEVTQPVMFGAWRPVVLLPGALRLETGDIREAVVAHELWHVRRRDWLLVVGEEVIRAALWFHPAVWWVLGEIRASREQVVDALAVAFTGRRAAYVRALLAFADATPLAPVAAFGWRRQLFRRILHVSREDAMSTKRFMSTVCALALVVGAGGWYGVRAFPLTSGTLDGAAQGIGPVEQRARTVTASNPLPRRVDSVMPTVPDLTGADVAGVMLILRITVDEAGQVVESRVARFEARAASSLRGSFVVEGGQVLDRLDAMLSEATTRGAPPSVLDQLTATRAVAAACIESGLDAVRQWRYEAPVDGPLTFDVAMSFANGTVSASPVVTVANSRTSTASTNPNAVSPLAEGAIRVGGGISPPKKIRDVKPVYPQEARDAAVQGVVILEVRIEGDGSISRARVLRSIPLLDEAAVDAVRQWQFTPTLLNGAPTPVIMTVTIQFSL